MSLACLLLRSARVTIHLTVNKCLGAFFIVISKTVPWEKRMSNRDIFMSRGQKLGLLEKTDEQSKVIREGEVDLPGEKRIEEILAVTRKDLGIKE